MQHNAIALYYTCYVQYLLLSHKIHIVLSIITAECILVDIIKWQKLTCESPINVRPQLLWRVEMTDDCTIWFIGYAYVTECNRHHKGSDSLRCICTPPIIYFLQFIQRAKTFLAFCISIDEEVLPK